MEENSRDKGGPAVDKIVSDFVSSLTDEQKMLVVLKRQLYDGDWETMLDDLKNRLAGKPYIFKLANRIQDDIARIEVLRKFEAEHNIDLADYVESV
jgi:chromosomal replication initiation ATPase DnaA